MDFKHPTQEYFKFTIIRDFCRFLQPGLTPLLQYFTRILLDFPSANHTRYLNLLWAQFTMIGNLLRTETSQKFLLRIFCYNNKFTWKVKDSQKLSILCKPCNTQNRPAPQQIFCVPDVMNKKSLNPILYYIENFPDWNYSRLHQWTNESYPNLAQIDTASGSRETFVKAWSSLLNNNANLNIFS